MHDAINEHHQNMTMKSEQGNAMRSHYCGDLRAAHSGEEVEIYGWVHRRRDHGGVIFLDIRDRTGVYR